jgi:hypothetical protein
MTFCKESFNMSKSVLNYHSLSQLLSATSDFHFLQRNVKSVILKSQYTQKYDLKAGKEIIFTVPHSLMLHNKAFTNKEGKRRKAVVHTTNIINHRLLTLYTSGHLLLNLLSYEIILSVCIYSGTTT